MSGESGVVVRRRGRAEVERLAVLYRTSGMARGEFCRSQGMALSTLNRYLKKQQSKQGKSKEYGVGRSRLVSVELATAVVTSAAGERPGALAVLLSNGRRVEVGRGFDAGTLSQLVTALERL